MNFLGKTRVKRKEDCVQTLLKKKTPLLENSTTWTKERKRTLGNNDDTLQKIKGGGYMG